MNKNLQKIKKTIVTLAFLLTISSSAFAQLYWEGIKTFNDDWGTTENIILIGNVTVYVAEGKTADFWGVISGGFSFTKTGPGTVRFLTDNTYTGGTTVAEGTLWIGHNTRGSVVGNIVNNGDLRIAPNYTYTDYTYSGVISGTGSLQKWAEKVTLNGKNTYSGYTLIVQGTLALGATGSIENSYIVNFESSASTTKFDISAGNKKIKALGQDDYNTSNAEVVLGNSTLTIGTAGQDDGGGIFTGNISGNGGITKYGKHSLNLNNTNSYEGTTTIEEGMLWIAGNVFGNIVTNADLVFVSLYDITYSKVISGTGNVHLLGSHKLILNGKNTYSGGTHITQSTLVLGSTGSIENSSGVFFPEDNGSILDISAGNKKINGLGQYGQKFSSSKVILGASTLTIDGGDFAGIFSGTGGVTKTGAGTFVMSGENSATGTFNLNGGTLQFFNQWAGNFTQAPGTTLDVVGVTSIGGNLSLNGGTISMDITQAPPSKINVIGTLFPTGTTKLNITSGTVTNHALMQAASGLSNATNFQLNMPGFDATLSANGTQLLLTATVADATPPTPGTGVNGTSLATEATITWETATDDFTPKENLRYFVYQSSSNNITTPADCETNGTLLNAGGTVNVATFTIKELTANTTYYFNVVVSDMAGNKAAYIPKELKTSNVGIASAELSKQINVYPNPTTGQLTMDNGQLTINGVEIFDVFGKKLFEEKENLTVLRSYDLTVFPAGVYFLKITTENGIITKKVIKH